MNASKQELKQLIQRTNDPRVLEGLASIMRRILAGESVESIAASYGVNLKTE